jgi:hypothetical protein
MALNAKNAGGGEKNFIEQDLIDIGNYPARLVQIIDLGVQPQRPFQGKDKPPIQEIMYTYELVDSFMKDEDGNELEDKPRWVSENMPFHGLYAENAKSTKRYNAFDPTGAFDGDVTKAIGMALNVAMVHNPKGEKVYANIGGVSPMRAKDAEKCTALKNPTKVFDLDNPDMDVFNKLPKWVQDKIKENLQYNGSPLQSKLGSKPVDEPKKEAKKGKEPAAPAPEEEENTPY